MYVCVYIASVIYIEAKVPAEGKELHWGLSNTKIYLRKLKVES